MKVIVLVKQVPSPQEIRIDPETGRLVREGVTLELNELDVYAVTEAVRLRELHGGEVVAITMGPPQAEEALRLCLLMGADRAVHLSDRAFAVADTLATSRALALAVEKEGADLVLCGRKSVDAETWQVPVETAALLAWPSLTSADRIEELAPGTLRVRRETDEGFDVYDVDLPAVVSVTESINEGIFPARRELQAFDPGGRIAVWTAADLAAGASGFGEAGSPTRVVSVHEDVPLRGAEVLATAAEAAARALELLEAAGGPPHSPWEPAERIAEGSHDCWTVVELLDGRPRRISLELLGKSRELAGKLGGDAVALVLGDGVEGAAREAVTYGADRVVVVEHERLGRYEPEPYTAALRRIVEEHAPHVLLIPSTSTGRDYGPRVAGELELGMTADCVGLDIDAEGRLVQLKPAYGGTIVSVILSSTTPQLATVRPGIFAPVEPRDDAVAEVVRVEAGRLPGGLVRLVSSARSPDTAGWELDGAEVIFGAGRGIGGPEALPELMALAARLGAVVGATRAVTDEGWLPKNRQIGLTGRAVSPRLYVAVGVRGAFEHMVGVTKAGVVVALNTSERAPVFRAADLGVVGDWRETLPPLVDALAGRLQ